MPGWQVTGDPEGGEANQHRQHQPFAWAILLALAVWLTPRRRFFRDAGRQ